MRAILWQQSTAAGQFVRERLHNLFKLADVEFEAVGTIEALLAAVAGSLRDCHSPYVILDCYCGSYSDIERCMTAIAHTSYANPSILVIHPSEQVVRDIEVIAGRPLAWLQSDFTVAILCTKLLTFQAASHTERSAVTKRPLLTAREQEVAELIADGLSNGEIEATLCIAKSTMKTHVRALWRKFGVTSRGSFIANYRGVSAKR